MRNFLKKHWKIALVIGLIVVWAIGTTISTCILFQKHVNSIEYQLKKLNKEIKEIEKTVEKYENRRKM